MLAITRNAAWVALIDNTRRHRCRYHWPPALDDARGLLFPFCLTTDRKLGEGLVRRTFLFLTLFMCPQKSSKSYFSLPQKHVSKTDSLSGALLNDTNISKKL